MPVSFDTLRAATRLQEEAGFSEQQARVLISTIADGMDEHLATKDDIAALSQRIDALDQKIDQRIVALDQKLDQRTVALDQKLDLSVAGLEHSMAAMEQRLLVRVGSMVAAATVIGIAAVGVLVSAM